MPRPNGNRSNAPILALLLFAAFAAFYTAETGQPATPPDRRPIITQRVSPSVVYIATPTRFGTGFSVNGKIYTCAHVIADSPVITVQDRSGRCQIAKLTRVNPDQDLAELTVKSAPKSLQLRAAPPHPGEHVWEIGNPGGLKWVLTDGIFVTVCAATGDNVYLVDTLAGSSGSPIVDNTGLVIGMTHRVFSGTRFTFGGALCDLRGFIYPNHPR